MRNLYERANGYISHEMNNIITTILMKFSCVKSGSFDRSDKGLSLEENINDIEKMLMELTRFCQFYSEFSNNSDEDSMSWQGTFEMGSTLLESKIKRYGLKPVNIEGPFPKTKERSWEKMMISIFVLGFAIENSAQGTSIQVVALDDLSGIKVRWAQEGDTSLQKLNSEYFDFEVTRGGIEVREK